MLSNIKARIAQEIEELSRKHIVNTLQKLIELPTVAAWGDVNEMRKGAELVSSFFKDLGFKVDIKSSGGNPAVFAEIGKGDKTLLIYNHYDVQPPDPLELWESDPFKLVERNGKLYGRGVADNKGNIAARIAALEALLPYIDDLNLRIKFIVEGEEEIGSPSLEKLVHDNLDWLRADGGIWETAYVRRDDRLSISLGFKGMLYLELKIKGPSRDVHSGYSPIIPNPAWRMVKLLTLLKNEEGKVLIPGFYEGIEEEFLKISEELIKELKYEEFESMKNELKIKEFVGGLRGIEAIKALFLTPSLNISGLYSGYTGKGSKTIIPSEAGVKIDIRLLPGQEPKLILDNLIAYLKDNGFQDLEIQVESMYKSGYTRPNERIVEASVRAATQAYGLEPQIMTMAAGSGPMYLFTNIAKVPMTGAGVGYYGSRVHSPNENIRIEDFVKGIKHVAFTLLEF